MMRLFRGEVQRPMRMLAGWRIDLKLAVRMLVRHPALSAIAVFGITVAIAIAATMFTILGEQFSPSELPLPEGHRIVAFQKWDSAKNHAEPLVPADVVTWREELSTVRDIGAFRTTTKNLIASTAAPELIEVAEMSAAGFDVAGIAPRLGRYLRTGDERAGAAPVVVIGHEEWRSRFGGNDQVLDTTVQLGDTHYTVIGVMPEGFAFPINHAYWIPLRLEATGDPAGGGAPLSVFGRLAPGSTLQNAQAELAAAGDRARNASPSTSRGLRPRVVRYSRQFAEMESPGNRVALELARFFVTILLVVVSVNIAVLVYARTAARQAEIAVRTALGASRGRMVAQLCGEGLVLAGLGALAGVGFTAVALDQIRAAVAQEEALPFWLQFQLSWRTIGYVVAFTATVAGIIGALPAWKATGQRIQGGLQALSAGGGGMQLGRGWTALIVLQVAVAAGLLPAVVVRMSELAREGMAGYGFAADEFLVAQLSIEQAAGAQPAAAPPGNRFATRYQEMEQRIAAGGTVRGTTFSSFAPGFEASARIRSDIGATETVSVLLLSAAGIYALMAFSVTRRRREIGIRLALGASARRILWTMFSRAAGQVLAGAGLGTIVAVLLDRAAGGEMMSDQAAIATACVVLLIAIAGLLAALGPARQGLRIQPTEALRDPSS